MPAAKQQDVKAVLRAFEPILRDVVMAAWRQWVEMPNRSRLYQRTRACFVHNFMMIEASRHLEGHPRAHVFEQHETAMFLFDQSVLVRLKKGDERGLSSNIPTQAALAFIDPQEELFDLPDVSRVDVCYVLNELQTQVKDILVVARDGDQVIWAYSIYSAAEGAAPVISFPAPANEPPAADSGMRIPGELENNKNIDGAVEE